MSKFNYTVEVEVNGQWVHANVATLAEAKALLTAFEAVDDEKVCIVDDEIYLNNDATKQAQSDYKAYQNECVTEANIWLKDMVAQGKMSVKDGVYTGRLVDM